MATPAEADESLRPEVLVAARVAGVHRVFKMGGAHAIAALAYGTESVPRVDKIVGPGNVYVATAKRLVFGDVSIDSEAGPTEVLIVADKTATSAWVAADLISQAEHDEMASAILVTNSKALVSRVQDQIKKQLKAVDRAKIAKAAFASGGAIILAKEMNDCIELSNRYAPEHLVIATDDADAAITSRVRITSCPRAERRGSSRRWAWKTSSRGRAFCASSRRSCGSWGRT
jgi:histidinol dehydrogenase